jgi:hypothetical protein
MEIERQWKSFAEGYENLHGQKLVRALGEMSIINSEGQPSYTKVVLELDSSSIEIKVDSETDEIVISSIFIDGMCDDLSNIDGLSDYIGMKLGWTWIGTNYLGYLDIVIFSFSGISPDIMFVACASDVMISKIVRITV